MRFCALSAAAMAAATLLSASPSQAACYGSGSFRTCYDDSGNSYNVTRYGNTTQVDGYNSATGSNWSQTSRSIGNTTYTDGFAANGSSWNSTTRSTGSGTYTYGTDANGNAFSTTCNRYGCF